MNIKLTVRPPIVCSISSYEFVLVRVYMLHIPRTHYSCTKCFGRELMSAGYLAETVTYCVDIFTSQSDSNLD